MATNSKLIKTPIAAKKQLSTNNYIAAVVAGTLILVLVCGLIGKGLINSLIINTKLVAHKAQAKHDLDTKLANIPILLSNYDGLGNKKQLISDGMPTGPDFPQVISILQGVGSAAGVDVSSIDPSSSDTSTNGGSATTSAPAATGSGTAPPAGDSGNSPTPYTFQTTITGPYAQIVAFFKNLELSDRPMHVTATDIASQTGQLTINATIQTYYQGKADISDKTEQIK